MSKPLNADDELRRHCDSLGVPSLWCDKLIYIVEADRKRVALEAEIAQLKSVVAGYEIYSHDATQFYKSIVKALLNKDERFYREYGEHALCQTDIDHLKAQQEVNDER